MTSPSVKAKLRAYFLENVGKVVTARELQAVAAPASEWARRVRELREEEGWPISTQHDDLSLKQGEYRLERIPETQVEAGFKRAISQRTRAEVLDRDGYTCQSCGLGAGDIDPDTGRKVRLHLGHIVDKSRGGTDDPSNLRTLCSTCNQGAKNLTLEKPSAIWLLQQVRRANLADQRTVLEWLKQRLEPRAGPSEL
ncbi:MAG: HNH endonuclease [Demequina sp.]|nr:HNH endonuclease [Demequina sp.]